MKEMDLKQLDRKIRACCGLGGFGLQWFMCWSLGPHILTVVRLK